MRFHMHHHHRACRSRTPFGHMGPGHRTHGRRGGRLGRMFEHGDLRHVLLALLADKLRDRKSVV